MKLIARSSSPASAGMTRSSSSRPHAGVRGEDAQALELVGGERLCREAVGVEELVGGHAEVGARDGALGRRLAEHDRGGVRLRLDRALRGEAEAGQLPGDHLPERRLGEEQEVVGRAAQHGQRCDQPRLRGQQQRLAGLARAERLDVVRDHPLQVGGGVGPGDADVRARPGGGL